MPHGFGELHRVSYYNPLLDNLEEAQRGTCSMVYEKNHEKRWEWVCNIQPIVGLELTLYTILIYVWGFTCVKMVMLLI
jgi:hypothetical protein